MTEAARIAPIEASSGATSSAEVAYRALGALDGAVWIEPAVRVLVQMRTAQLEAAVDRLAGHVREAVELGETHERLVDLGRWRSSPLFTERERAALAVADALTLPAKRRSTGAALRRAARYFDQRELVQLALACAATAAWARIEPIERSQT